MDYNDFASKIQVLDKYTSMTLRNKYINKFIDTKHKLYKRQIEERKKFIDGYCYTGYLWDFLTNSEVSTEDNINNSLRKHSQVYVFWDIHSCERIFIYNYWKFEKEAVLKLELDILLRGLEYLPEDIYIFDDSFMWTFAYTHEEVSSRRLCLKIGEV